MEIGIQLIQGGTHDFGGSLGFSCAGTIGALPLKQSRVFFRTITGTFSALEAWKNLPSEYEIIRAGWVIFKSGRDPGMRISCIQSLLLVKANFPQYGKEQQHQLTVGSSLLLLTKTAVPPASPATVALSSNLHSPRSAITMMLVSYSDSPVGSGLRSSWQPSTGDAGTTR